MEGPGIDPTDDAGPNDSSSALACPTARFVDPFTDDDLITPFWSRDVVNGVASLGTAEAGASTPGSLRASARDSGGGQAYLQLIRGRLPATWSFCLSFALKLLGPPDRALFGPRIVSNTGGTNSTIAIELVGYNVSLAFYNDGCPDGGTACRRDERVPVGTIVGDEWTTITLLGTFESSSATVTTLVGGGTPRRHEVTVPMHGFETSSLHVGISTLLSAESVDLLIDDLRYDDTLP